MNSLSLYCVRKQLNIYHFLIIIDAFWKSETISLTLVSKIYPKMCP